MSERKGHPPRLPTWDYANAGAYFVTFKVDDRRPILSAVEHGMTTLTPAGKLVRRQWEMLPATFPVGLDALVIMPDHVHSILLVRGERDTRPKEYGWTPLMSESAALLGKIVRSWKAASALAIRRSVEETFRWQSRYYERVIRDQRELERTRAYIDQNPYRWRGAEIPGT